MSTKPGVIADIMSLFRTAPVGQGTVPPVNPPPVGQTNPGQPLPGTQQTEQTAPNGMIPTQPAPQAGDPNDPQSLLAGFANVWNPANVDQNKQSGPVFAKLDPAKVMESAKGVDFAKSLDPALLAKISAGGEEAAGAFVQAMNSMTQSGFGQGAITTARLIDEALARQRTQFMEELPGLVRQHAVTDGLQTENPIMNNPAIKPLVSALQSQLTVQHPNASAREIQQKVNEYFSAFGQVFAPKQEPQKGVSRGGKPSGEQDFSSFLFE